jgi:hypothetical protein
VRVMHEGTAVKGMEWIEMEGFVDLLEGIVAGDVFGECMGG